MWRHTASKINMLGRILLTWLNYRVDFVSPLVETWHVMSSSFLLPSNCHLHMLRYLCCMHFIDCLNLELLLFLHPKPQYHLFDLPNKLMIEEKNGLKVPHLKPEDKTPHSSTSDWIMVSWLKITELATKEGLTGTYFRWLEEALR